MKQKEKLSTQASYDLCREVFIKFVMNVEQLIITTQIENIETVKFVNYDSWDWIEPMIMLKSRLSSNSEMKKLCRDRIYEVINTSKEEWQIEVNKNVFKRLLEGEILGVDLLKQAEIDGDQEEQLEMLLKIIMQLVTIVEMGGSDKFSTEQANDQLNGYKSKAYELLISNPSIR